MFAQDLPISSEIICAMASRTVSENLPAGVSMADRFSVALTTKPPAACNSPMLSNQSMVLRPQRLIFQTRTPSASPPLDPVDDLRDAPCAKLPFSLAEFDDGIDDDEVLALAAPSHSLIWT